MLNLNESQFEIVTCSGHADGLKLIKVKNGSDHAFHLENASGEPAVLREVVVHRQAMGYPANTRFYAEGSNMLSQYWGTIGQIQSTVYTDRLHYRFPVRPGMFTVYNLIQFFPDGGPPELAGFTSCRRFTNEIRFLGKKTERDTHQDAEEATKAEVDRQIADTLALHPEVKDLNIKIVPKLKWVSDIADGMLEETNSGLYDLLIKGANHHGILDSIIFTPHDWFQNGNTASLHMTLDDATDKILSGYFMPTECQLGYCHAFKLMLEKNGIPQAIYSDRTTILWNPKDGELTQVGRMLDELGIELIYANTAEAKGKIENKNKVVQNRLLNDIIRFKIKTYDEYGRIKAIVSAEVNIELEYDIKPWSDAVREVGICVKYARQILM